LLWVNLKTLRNHLNIAPRKLPTCSVWEKQTTMSYSYYYKGYHNGMTGQVTSGASSHQEDGALWMGELLLPIPWSPLTRKQDYPN
jgi:hypothetical protein